MTIEEYLIKLCKHTGLADDQFTIIVNDSEGKDVATAKIELPESESGLFIGYHGETLDSIQRLVRISFYDQLAEKRFKLNVNNYRQQRNEQLEEKTANIARRVQETGLPYTFPYLTAHDRFVIHSTLGESEEFDDLESVSEGEGKDRYLTVRLKADSEFETSSEPQVENEAEGETRAEDETGVKVEVKADEVETKIE